MRVQRSHLRLALFVLVLAVLYNMWVFFRPAARSTPLANRQQPLLQSDDTPAVANPEAIDPVSIQAPPAIDVSASPVPGRDPFLFGDERRDGWVRPALQARTPDPVVRTILFSANRKTAIVENRMVSVGDAVGSLTVVQIDRDAVVFAASDGERRRVLLHRASPAGITR